jgi:hypothetical protein
LDGAATEAELRARLEAAAGRASEKSRFRFYFTGHGSASKGFENHTLDLWDGGEMSVRDLADALDRFPDRANVQVVMTQCYAGGFARLIFRADGTPSPADRCGFFAQRADRESAGCSPDPELRDEYSVPFIAALRSRGGVGAAEAHAFALIHDRSIDVPVTTSSEFLRFTFKTPPDLASDGRDWAWLIAGSDPIEARVAREIASGLGFQPIGGESLTARIGREIAQATASVDAADARYRETREGFDALAEPLYREVSARHPIFETQFGARFGAAQCLTPDRLAEAKKAVFAHPLFASMRKAYTARDSAYGELQGLVAVRARWERLRYLTETRALRDLLAAPGSEEARRTYDRLRRCEARPFL